MSEILPEIVARHAEEAAFLWLLRDRAVNQPHYLPRQLADLDDRIEAHLDGLRIAGDAGWAQARQQLELAEPGEVFTAGVLAFGGHDAKRRQQVLDVAAAKPGLDRAVAAALAWLPAATAMAQIQNWFASKDAVFRLIAVRTAAAHRRAVPQLESALYDNDLHIRARALRAIGELGEIKRLAVLNPNYRHEDPMTRFSACWAGALACSDPAAVAELQTIAFTDARFGEPAADLAARRMSPAQAQPWLKTLFQVAETSRAALRAAGALGDPAYVPQLLSAMRKPALARLAGEAFELITGADLALDKLDAPAPADFQAGPNDNPADANVELDPDANLLWPNPDAVKAWWEKRKGTLSAGRRHFLGRPPTPESFEEVWRSSKQRHRIAAAVELAPRRPLRAWKARLLNSI